MKSKKCAWVFRTKVFPRERVQEDTREECENNKKIKISFIYEV